MTGPHTSRIVRWLANLDCSLEDYQSFAEQGAVREMEVSRTHMRTAVDGIREALANLERSVGLDG
jgi:hypothetical protein